MLQPTTIAETLPILVRNEIEQVLPIEEIAESVLQDFMAEMRKQHPDNAVLANARLIVVSGLPATRIPEVACLTGAGHIVMGGNGRTSLSKLMAGSVSEKVIRQSPVPVTIVHSNGTAREGASADVRQSEPRRLLRTAREGASADVRQSEPRRLLRLVGNPV
jgi:nucleotide-binding universal stress UspA family protein